MASNYPKKLIISLTAEQYIKIKAVAKELDCTLSFLFRKFVDNMKVKNQ